MNYVQDNNNPYLNWGMTASQADENTRASFIRKTYVHLLGAVLAFCGIEAVLLNSPIAEPWTNLAFSTQLGWFAIILAFTGVSYLANSWALSTTNLGTQYLGLGLYVVAQSFITLPLLYIAKTQFGPEIITNAALLTGVIFVGLTAAVFISGVDFSFLRSALTIGLFAAIGVALCSWMFGFNLGILFVGAMLVLSAGYILYYTSNVMHHYRVDQYVAAALALFAAVALLFWYVLQLLMSLNRR